MIRYYLKILFLILKHKTRECEGDERSAREMEASLKQLWFFVQKIRRFRDSAGRYASSRRNASSKSRPKCTTYPVMRHLPACSKARLN